MGILDGKENRRVEARQHLQEALKIRRQLAEHNSDMYLPYVARTLINLGILDGGENRKDEAKEAFQEALIILQQLGAKDPDAYGNDVERVQRLLDGLNK